MCTSRWLLKTWERQTPRKVSNARNVSPTSGQVTKCYCSEFASEYQQNKRTLTRTSAKGVWSAIFDLLHQVISQFCSFVDLGIYFWMAAMKPILAAANTAVRWTHFRKNPYRAIRLEMFTFFNSHKQASDTRQVTSHFAMSDHLGHHLSCDESTISRTRMSL
ncbi:hypothetical protein RB195_015566 [Necator americanus]|uniref:Uncharacterized protein n=1 Tax=Necator americanus TaxID=51031 RepID=A0ABR1E553_NECAM